MIYLEKRYKPETILIWWYLNTITILQSCKILKEIKSIRA